MRISTANSFDTTINHLAKRQADLSALQERLGTGKRVLKASDDPVAATLAETAGNRLSRTQSDLRALENSRASLQQAESGLAESGELIQRVRELMVSAGNGAFGPGEREDVARQLEGLREQLINVANRQDNAGRTLFGGLGGSATPFVDVYGPTGTGVQFSGQRGQAAAGTTALPQSFDGDAIWMRIPQGNGQFRLDLNAGNTGGLRTDMGEVTDHSALTGHRYEISFSDASGVLRYSVTNLSDASRNPLLNQVDVPYEAGKAIQFDGMSLRLVGQPNPGDSLAVNPVSSSPTDLFKVVQDAIDALRTTGPGRSAQQTQQIARAMVELDAGHDRVLLARARAGEWLNRADSLGSMLNDQSTSHEIERSRLEDLDLVRGISDFQTQQVGLEAAMKSYAQVRRLSLFQFVA
ncbi:MAG: flagellar hook-associated protein FlgL [Hydrogenophaga sp.]|jgi:flagellar hook-associated protein 3 FlgL|nr:flagellar hook-associated protein FlgL [Hydrogenophaga sp.]